MQNDMLDDLQDNGRQKRRPGHSGVDDRQRDSVGRGGVRVHGEERVRTDEAGHVPLGRADPKDAEGVRGQGRRPAEAALRR